MRTLRCGHVPASPTSWLLIDHRRVWFCDTCRTYQREKSGTSKAVPHDHHDHDHDNLGEEQVRALDGRPEKAA